MPLGGVDGLAQDELTPLADDNTEVLLSEAGCDLEEGNDWDLTAAVADVDLSDKPKEVSLQGPVTRSELSSTGFGTDPTLLISSNVNNLEVASLEDFCKGLVKPSRELLLKEGIPIP